MVDYDPYMPEIMEDPHPVYAELRAESPVHYIERFDAWALALFDDIWEASADDVHFSVGNSTAERGFLEGEPATLEVLSNMDPPRHTALRRELFPYFGPRAARALEPQVRAWARECIAEHASSGRMDAVNDLAQPIAFRVACAVSGFPVEDASRLIRLVRDSFQREEGVEGAPERVEATREEMRSYLFELASRHETGERKVHALDVLSAASDEEGRFSPERVGSHLTLLLVGATETFPKAFASGLKRLWEHPDQRRELQDDPRGIPKALQEMLRYDMPTQWLGRTTIRDCEIRGRKIRAGQPVLFLYPSANRDAREFDEPDRFDIHRDPQRILTFGTGTHRCLGAFMAEMEGRVLFEELLRSCPDFEVIEEETVWPRTEFVQGYRDFPIAFTPPR